MYSSSVIYLDSSELHQDMHNYQNINALLRHALRKGARGLYILYLFILDSVMIYLTKLDIKLPAKGKWIVTDLDTYEKVGEISTEIKE